jgi:nucleotidyltransferase substrate binding protein (TIGR01987 family)
MSEQATDIRWRQRLSSYTRALASLTSAVELARQRPLSDLEKQGLIQAFEFTHELAWNLMKDYFAYQGTGSIAGSRDAVREAFAVGLLADGEGWMQMIRSRNLSSQSYNRAVADEISGRIVEEYHPLFEDFLARMKSLAAVA